MMIDVIPSTSMFIRTVTEMYKAKVSFHLFTCGYTF